MLGILDAEQYSRLFHALSVASEPDDTLFGEIDSGYLLEPFHNHPSMERVLIVARHDRRAYPLGSSAGRPKSLEGHPRFSVLLGGDPSTVLVPHRMACLEFDPG